MKNKKPKVAYIIADAVICGGVGVVCQHANRLARRGFETCIVSTTGDEKINWFPDQRVPVYPLSRIPGDIDIGVATWWETTHDLYGLEIPRKFYFVQSDETRFYEEDRFEKLFAYDSYWSDYEFMTEAKWIRKWLKDSFDREAHYVPNGVDLEIFHETKPLVPKGELPRILIEGPADMPSKGVAEAFRAVSGLKCEVWYVNYRGIPDPAWKVDRYFYRVPMSEMRRIYSSCDILLKLSTVEGSFGPPLEMMACGGVCVVARVSGMEEGIIAGENALVVEPGDLEGARDALGRLFDDETLRQKLIQQGRETVKRLDWEKSIDALEKIYLSHAPPGGGDLVSFQKRRMREKEEILIKAYDNLKAMRKEMSAGESLFHQNIEKKDREIGRLTHLINRKSDEINSIYHSKQWKIAAAFKEARHSFKAFVKLPTRLVRSLF
jgi:glycosyltransferase involved in cell wall biosynthesis